jgi:lipoprotein-anchoring transpeptidase ErfK/SrfK
MRAVRLLLLAAALTGSSGCETIGGTDAAFAGSEEAPVVDTEPMAAIVAEPALPSPPPREEVSFETPAELIPSAPAFDPEAEARERELAARAQFEAEWPLHGIAYHFLAQVRARPDASSPVIGYIRRGSRFRAKAGLRGPGCSRGWHEIVGQGFVCRGEGFLLGESPQTFEPSPVPAALEDALPYAYAYVAHQDAPQYWRLPSALEERDAASVMERLRAQASRLETAESVSSEERGAPSAEPDLEAPPGLALDAVASVADAGVAPVDAALPTVFRMRMLRGFYVSIDREELDGERRFFRTVRGSYVPADVLSEASPSSMRGVVLGGAWQPPMGFVFRRGVRSLVRDAVTGALTQSDSIEVHTPLLFEEEALDRRGTRYRISRDGRVVRESALRMIHRIERPTSIGENDRWIHVDLSEQTLVAYEGNEPVFATLVSTGRAGFATPTGTFRIQSKHVSTTMDDPDSLTEAYSIEDVPWTMYFEGSYALHGAFWHGAFGHVRSHGCVNLAPTDARWLFQWTTPTLPPGWHGVIASSRRTGSWVHVTE